MRGAVGKCSLVFTSVLASPRVRVLQPRTCTAPSTQPAARDEAAQNPRCWDVVGPVKSELLPGLPSQVSAPHPPSSLLLVPNPPGLAASTPQPGLDPGTRCEQTVQTSAGPVPTESPQPRAHVYHQRNHNGLACLCITVPTRTPARGTRSLSLSPGPLIHPPPSRVKNQLQPGARSRRLSPGSGLTTWKPGPGTGPCILGIAALQPRTSPQPAERSRQTRVQSASPRARTC